MFSIVYESTDISDYVISFERNIQICTGIGTLDFVVTKGVPVSFATWDTVLLYEAGVKKGVFNVSTITRDASTGNYLVSCQDNSKRLVDYFITDFYEINYYSTSKYWIEKFLTEAGVDYIFKTDAESSPLSENTSLGLNSAYDTIIYLLQLNGWFIYFNKEGKAVIGNLKASLTSGAYTFDDSEILNLKENKNDSMLRNRAVVWGNSGIFYDNSVDTAWNYDTNDKRAVVLANSSIRDNDLAAQLGEKILDEFAQLTHTVTLECHGYYNLNIGEVVRINSDYYKDSGVLTTLSTRGSSNGFITTITINERCPRLFGIFYFYGDYVYIATKGSGVWRKSLNDGDFEDFSSGLEDLDVVDLYVANEKLACVTEKGLLYTRNSDDFSWTEITWGDLTDEIGDESISADVITAIACTINRETSEVYVLLGGASRLWVGKVDNSAIGTTRQVYLNIDGKNQQYLVGYDIDTDNSQIFVTCKSSIITSPIFLQHSFPVVEAFTYNDTEEFRTFGKNYGLKPSNIVWDYGKVYYINSPINYNTHTSDPSSFYVYVHDFRGSEVITTVSPKMTVSGEDFEDADVFLSRDKTSLYIVTDQIYRYSFIDKNVEFVRSRPNGTIYDRVVVNINTSDKTIDGVTYRTYTLRCEDLETEVADEIDFGTITVRDNQWVNSCGVSHSFNNLGILYYSVSKNNLHPDDNWLVGLHSYDEEYFTYVHMFGIIYNYMSRSIIAVFNKLIHPQPDLEPSDTYCTSHVVIDEPGMNSTELIARWTYINYREGIPWIYGQYKLRDRGPWVWNGLYYEHLEHRENYPETDTYPRVFKYNPISDEFSVLDDTKFNQTYLSSSYVEYLDAVYLSNSSLSDYWYKQYTAGVAIVEYWRDIEQNQAPNMDTPTNLYKHHIEKQNKIDYFYYELPVIVDRTGLYNKYGIQIGWEWWFRTMPFVPLAERPTISGYTHRIKVRSKSYARPNLAPLPNIIEQNASQNVLAAKYQEQYWNNAYGDYEIHYGWEFYQFGDWANFFTQGYYTTLVTNSGSSLILDLTSSPHSLEVASGGPIVTYAKNFTISGVLVPSGVPSGILRIGNYYQPSGLILPSGYIPGSGFQPDEIPDYTFITPAGEYSRILDARPFTLLSGIPTPSGQYNIVGSSHVGIAMDKGVYIYDIVSSGNWQTLNTFSGFVTNFETSNYYNTPYFFAATLDEIDVVLSGTSEFYQRDTNETAWDFYSPPSGYITSIRLDDRL